MDAVDLRLQSASLSQLAFGFFEGVGAPLFIRSCPPPQWEKNSLENKGGSGTYLSTSPKSSDSATPISYLSVVPGRTLATSCAMLLSSSKHIKFCGDTQAGSIVFVASRLGLAA